MYRHRRAELGDQEGDKTVITVIVMIMMVISVMIMRIMAATGNYGNNHHLSTKDIKEHYAGQVVITC